MLCCEACCPWSNAAESPVIACTATWHRPALALQDAAQHLASSSQRYVAVSSQLRKLQSARAIILAGHCDAPGMFSSSTVRLAVAEMCMFQSQSREAVSRRPAWGTGLQMPWLQHLQRSSLTLCAHLQRGAAATAVCCRPSTATWAWRAPWTACWTASRARAWPALTPAAAPALAPRQRCGLSTLESLSTSCPEGARER